MASNGSSRPKRRPSGSPEVARPQKRERQEIQSDVPFTLNGPEPDNFSESVASDIDFEERILPVPTGTHDSAEWQKTIERVVRSVVSIRFCLTCSFDTEGATTSEATGFIVDSEKGYILTNRHVVSPGPFWGYCVFDNHEECDVYPVYRDPVHDFGILRFDPKAIKYMPVTALVLRPDLARKRATFIKSTVADSIKVLGPRLGLLVTMLVKS